jgi:hydrogenase-4 component B
MTPLELALLAAFCCAVSGVPALFRKLPPQLGRRVSYSFVTAGAVMGLSASAEMLLNDGRPETVEVLWNLPLGSLLFRFDPLSAFFFIPILIIAFCVSLYACGYCATSFDNRSESLLTFYLGLAVSAMLMLTLAANGLTLLVFWEVMALTIFFAMNQEHAKSEVRQAGLHYLVASHVTTLLIIVIAALLPGGGMQQFPATGTINPVGLLPTAIMLTALFGFGLKAGIMPLHIWLPAAHANAPSHISALMSGVMIKLGIYGIIRVLSFFSPPPIWWGILILTFGVISAVGGVLFAIGQHDIKRLLAYHSIENIGIIVMGIGIAQIGLSSSNHILFVLGMAGALLHIVNHALFKSLLFMGAGAIIHVAGTRNIDRMGGLASALPVTSILFLIGAVAICGLPPLNGFVSEFLIYLGLFKGFGTSTGSAAALLSIAAPSLALTGGLALACFVKVFGCVFLGAPRANLPEPHENAAMTSAMAIISALCILIGVLPFAVTRFIEPVILSLFPQKNVLLPSIQTTAHLFGLSVAAVALFMILVLLIALYINRLKTKPIGETVTWDCGYAAPSATMQYTASSFAQMLVGIFGGVLRPERHEPAVSNLFPQKERFESHVPEVVLDQGIIPVMLTADRWFASIRRLQSGQLNRYILYIFIALVVLLVISDVI